MKCYQLRHLWLDRCKKITDVGLDYLKEGLEKLAELRSLSLDFRL